MIKEKSFWTPAKPNPRIKATRLFGFEMNPKPNPNFTTLKPRPPISPVKLSLYSPKRNLHEIKLIDRKPWADTDKDGIPNYFDCKPLNKMFQDFGKFKHRPAKKGKTEKRPIDMTAAERFGGANIRKLKKIGEGADRKVFQLDKTKVLKVAKRPRGISQNIMESDLGGYLGQIEHFETGKDYVVMEKAEPLTPEQKTAIRRLKREFEEKRRTHSKEDEIKIAVDILEKAKQKGLPLAIDPQDLLNYDAVPTEILTPSQWKQKNGQIALVDPGGLSRDVIEEPATMTGLKRLSEGYGNFYRMEPKAAATMLQEWGEVKSERRIYKEKGTPRKTKRQHPFEYQDSHQERIIHSQWNEGNTYAHVLEGAGDIFREAAIHLDNKYPAVHSSYVNEKLDRIKRHLAEVERMKRDKVWDEDYKVYKEALEDPNAGIQMVFDPERTRGMRYWRDLAAKGMKTGIHPEDSYEAAIEAHPEKINKMIKQWRKQPVETKLQETARQLNIAMLKKDFDKVKELIPEIEQRMTSQRTAMERIGEQSLVSDAIMSLTPKMKETMDIAIRDREFEATPKRMTEPWDKKRVERYLREGYTLQEINAEEFKKRFEEQHKERLDWKPERLTAALQRNVDDDYPIVTLRRDRVDVSDGRHRITAAAHRGQKIDVLVHPYTPMEVDKEKVKEEDKRLTELKYVVKPGMIERRDWLLKNIADTQSKTLSSIKKSLKDIRWDKSARVFPPRKDKKELRKISKEEIEKMDKRQFEKLSKKALDMVNLDVQHKKEIIRPVPKPIIRREVSVEDITDRDARKLALKMTREILLKSRGGRPSLLDFGSFKSTITESLPKRTLKYEKRGKDLIEIRGRLHEPAGLDVLVYKQRYLHPSPETLKEIKKVERTEVGVEDFPTKKGTKTPLTLSFKKEGEKVIMTQKLVAEPASYKSPTLLKEQIIVEEIPPILDKERIDRGAKEVLKRMALEAKEPPERPEVLMGPGVMAIAVTKPGRKKWEKVAKRAVDIEKATRREVERRAMVEAEKLSLPPEESQKVAIGVAEKYLQEKVYPEKEEVIRNQDLLDSFSKSTEKESRDVMDAVQDLKEQSPSQDAVEDLIEKEPKESSFAKEALETYESDKMKDVKEAMEKTAQQISNE